MTSIREFKITEEYSYAIDAINENDWNSIIKKFKDATINQTWAWSSIMSKEISSLIIKKNDVIVGAAILRIFKVPAINAGIAYIGYGPMWRLNGEDDEIKNLQYLIFALRAEYVKNRGLFLKISPNIFTNLTYYEKVQYVFEKEKYQRKDLNNRTLFLDISQSLEQIRENFHRKWRACLNKAEKNNLSIYEGTDEKTFNAFKCIYENMLSRKQYSNPIDIHKYEMIYKKLPDLLKPVIIICESDGIPAAGIIISTMGETAIPWLLASGSRGIETHAAYLVQWEVIKMLKQRGIRIYDLGGCTPEKNYNTYLFKYRMVGKDPIVFSQIGIMEACDSWKSKILVRSWESLKLIIKRITNNDKRQTVIAQNKNSASND